MNGGTTVVVSFDLDALILVVGLGIVALFIALMVIVGALIDIKSALRQLAKKT